MEENEVEDWERREDETPKAWAAFRKYRDMGLIRSLSKVAKDYSKPASKKRQLQTWSSKYKWVIRCESYDAHEDEVLMKENEAELKKMGSRHAKLSMILQQKGLEKMRTITEVDTSKLSVGDALRLTTEGMRFERLSRGESTERTEQMHSFEDIFMEAFNGIQESKPNSGKTKASDGKSK